MITNLISKPIKPSDMRGTNFCFHGKHGKLSPSFSSLSDAVNWLLSNDEVNEFDMIITTDKEIMNG